MNKQRTLQIAIVAGEASGDQIAAGLIEAIKARFPNSRFIGVGGKLMAQAGCERLFDMEKISVIGFDGLFTKLFGILKIRRALLARFTADRPDIFIGVDVPDFNLPLARKLKRDRITCLHYVSPTIWAWRGYRIHKIRRSTDHMLTLFPFENSYYHQHGVPVTCVGHPIADAISMPDRASAYQQLHLAEGLWIALLPGSRNSEIKRLGAIFMDAARNILLRYPQAKFVLPLASEKVAQEFYKVVGNIDDLPVRILDGNARLALEACTVAVVASGTAALEAALLRRPHIVVYKLPRLSYWLVSRLVKLKYYSMANQLLREPVVPELFQKHATADAIAREVDVLLQDPKHCAWLEEQFADLHRQLKLNANVSAANVVLKLVGVAS